MTSYARLVLRERDRCLTSAAFCVSEDFWDLLLRVVPAKSGRNSLYVVIREILVICRMIFR